MLVIPFDQRDGFIWMNGDFLPWQEARTHVLSHGLHYASSVFEGTRAYGGKIFKLNAHTERLFASAKMLDMQIPYTVEQLNAVQKDALIRSNYQDAYIRPVAWRGSEMMAISAQNTKTHVAVAVWEWPSYFPPEKRMAGLKLAMAHYRRPSPESAPVHAKAAGLYMICTLSKHKVEREGWDDALMLDYRGRIAESTGANVFFVKDGELHTPVPYCFLNGITRQTVIELAKERNICVHERTILPDELGSFSEVFLVGTAIEVTPVSQIDAHRYQPGRLCEDLMRAYDHLVHGR